MRRLLLALVLSLASLHSRTSAAEEESAAGPSYQETTRASIGLFVGMGGGHDDIYTSAITGARLGAHITPRNWIMTSFGKGSFLFDDGYAQEGGGVWEAEVSFAHLRCNTGSIAICFAPTVGVGYQNGWAEFADSLVMDDPWTETVSRLFISARLGGRVVLDEHVGLELGIGLRGSHGAWGDQFVVGTSMTAAIDGAF